MGKIIYGFVKGLLIGLVIGIILSIFVGFEATLNCVGEWIGAFFGCGSCYDGCSYYLWDKDVQNCIMYCSIISALVSGVYSTYVAFQDMVINKKRIADLEIENAKKQRIQWANEAKQLALKVSCDCKSNESGFNSLISTEYQSEKMIELISMELTNVSELQGKIEAMVKDIEKKGE